MKRATTLAFVLAALAVSLALAAFVSPWASGQPDGLEKAAADAGLGPRMESDQVLAGAAPMPDYAVPGVASERTRTALAGLAGTLVAFAAAAGAAVLLRIRRRPGGREAAP